MIAALKAEIASFKVPKRVHFVDELPRNAMGKVQKNVLRERFGGRRSQETGSSDRTRSAASDTVEGATPKPTPSTACRPRARRAALQGPPQASRPASGARRGRPPAR